MTPGARSDAAIRPASKSDVPALDKLGAEMVRTHYAFDPKRFIAPSPRTEEGYGSFLGSQVGQKDAIVLVAEMAGAVVGYVYAEVAGFDYMSLRGPAGVLTDIVVDPAHRGQGIGRLLLNAAIAALEARGVPRIVLSTAQQNETAQKLFASAGFRRTMIEMTRESGGDKHG
ncbi:MAG TPA: N-acetyltransferase [Gemmatimonadaceae bacterium]